MKTRFSLNRAALPVVATLLAGPALADYVMRTPVGPRAAAIAPTLGTFTVPDKTISDAPFSLIAPVSNSSGAWSYASSNPAVASISGSTVTLAGTPGSSVITATQAAAGNYAAGSVSATLTVTAPVVVTQSTLFSSSNNPFFAINTNGFGNVFVYAVWMWGTTTTIPASVQFTIPVGATAASLSFSSSLYYQGNVCWWTLAKVGGEDVASGGLGQHTASLPGPGTYKLTAAYVGTTIDNVTVTYNQ